MLKMRHRKSSAKGHHRRLDSHQRMRGGGDRMLDADMEKHGKGYSIQKGRTEKEGAIPLLLASFSRLPCQDV